MSFRISLNKACASTNSHPYADDILYELDNLYIILRLEKTENSMNQFSVAKPQ